MKKTRAKNFKVRMFYHLQNLFWGVLSVGFWLGGFLFWGFGLGGFCLGGLSWRVFVWGFMSRGFCLGGFCPRTFNSKLKKSELETGGTRTSDRAVPITIRTWTCSTNHSAALTCVQETILY